MTGKKYVQHIFGFLFLCIAIEVVIFISHQDITAFHKALYFYSRNRNADTIITKNLFPKIIVAVVFVVMGIYSYFVYIAIINQRQFLQLAQSFFLGAACICSLWEYETMFYISTFSRRFWIHQGDIVWLLFLSSLLYSFRDDAYVKREKIINGFQNIVQLLAVVILAVSSHKIGIYIVVAAAGLEWLVALFWQINHFHEQSTSEKMAAILVCSGNIAMICLYFAMRTTSNLLLFAGREMMLLYVIIIFVVSVLFFWILSKYRQQVLLSKDVNRQISFANQYRYEIASKIIEVIDSPVRKMKETNDMILGIKGKPDMTLCFETLQANNVELERIEKTLKTLQEQEQYVEGIYSFDRIYIEYVTILHDVNLALKNKGSLLNHISFRIPDMKYLICCDPYYVSRALIKLIRELHRVDETQEMHIESSGSDGWIQTTISVSYMYDNRKRIKNIWRLLKNYHFTKELPLMENLPLTIAKNAILQQKGRIHAKIEDYRLTVEVSFPIVGKKSEKSQSEQISQLESNTFPKVVLVSNQLSQLGLIRSYLAQEKINLITFISTENALEYISTTPNIAVVLIDNILSRWVYNMFCDEIRKKFTLVELPVFLIQNRKFDYNEEKMVEGFNGVLVEPFSRRQLLYEIHNAMRIKQAERELDRYKADFLQTQMNPHFIFNAISVIMPLCLKEPEKAYSTLEYFAEYLRGNLFAGNLHTVIPIGKEIELIRAFLEIEKIRFHKMVEYEIIQECSDELPILPLMIEPLVENCVQHGRIPNQVLKIDIEINETKDGLFVCVTDNGAGMTSDVIQMLKSGGNIRSFGLVNVIKRLQLYYQENIEIESKEGEGTSISFYISSKK